MAGAERAADVVYTRELGVADAGAYRALRLEALASEPTAFGRSHAEELARDPATTSERIVRTPDTAVFGAFRGGTLIGSAGYVRHANEKERHKAFVWGVYVTGAERGHGTGRRVVEAVLADLRAQSGVRRVTIAVNATNERALALYTSLGFVVYGQEPEALLVNGRYYDELFLSLLLGA